MLIAFFVCLFFDILGSREGVGGEEAEHESL